MIGIAVSSGHGAHEQITAGPSAPASRREDRDGRCSRSRKSPMRLDRRPALFEHHGQILAALFGWRIAAEQQLGRSPVRSRVAREARG